MINRMNMNLIIALLALLFTLPGICIVHASKVNSVDISNVDKKTVIDYMVNELLGRGFNIITVTDYQAILRKDVDDFKMRLLYGSRYNTTPEFRISFNFVQIADIVKVTAESRIVTNPNSSFEQSQVISGNDTQKMLERYKVSLEQKHAEPSFGFKYVSTLMGGNVFINDITAGSSADKAGLKYGDRVIKINGTIITDISTFSDALKGPAGSRIQLTLKLDNGDEKNLEIEKK